MRDQVFVKTDTSASRKKRAYVIWGVFGVLLCVGLVGAYFYYWSSFLQIREFVVDGVQDADGAKKEIVNYFEGARGIFSPASDRIVFWMGKDGVIATPSFMPYASSLSIATDFSQKRVTAHIVPRVMTGVWCTGGECYVFDKNGVVFEKSPDVAGSLILKIRDDNNTPVSFGGTVLTPDEFISMTNAIEHVAKNNIPVSEVVIQNRELREWATVAPNGFSVKFSFNSIPDDLDSVFAGVFERASLSKLTYIDLRVPNRVYFK